MDWQRLLPPYWIQNYPTSMALDDFINTAIDLGLVDWREGSYRANVGGKDVWVENWPYAYGQYRGFLPTVRTRKRLRRAIMMQGIKDAAQ